MKDTFWVDWDPVKRQIAGNPPTLPQKALPYQPTPKKRLDGGSGGQKTEGKAEPGVDPEKIDELPGRPYDIETLRERLAALIDHYEKVGTPATKAQRGTFIGMVRLALVQLGLQKPDVARKQILMELFGVDSGTKLSYAMIHAGLRWADPTKDDETGKTMPCKEFVREINELYILGDE